MKALNSSSGKELAGNLAVADNLPRRMIGLLGKTALASDEGLWIKPCKGIHTFGMKFPIDAVFLNREFTVIGVRTELAPYRLTPVYVGAASVLELHAGKVEETATKIGDVIIIS